LFPEKYSFEYYHPRSVVKRKKLNERAKALQREQEYLEEMPLAQRFPPRSSKSHGSKISTKALNQHPNLQPIKITPDSSSQIRQIDKPLDNLTYDQVADTPFSDEGLGTDYDTVEQNFDPTHLANNDNKQFPRLIHTQNSNDDPNDQIYNRDDLQVEPHFSMRADFRTNDISQHDSQSIKVDPHRIMTKAQIHLLPENSNKQHFKAFSDNNSLSQKRNLDLETQNPQNEHFRSHDDREIVMANDEAFGALDFQHDDKNFDADSELLPPTFSDKSQTQFSPNVRNPDIAPHSNDETNDIHPNDILPTAQSFDETPTTPTDKLDSNVEDKPHTETEPQLIQQRDNVSTVDPVPESKYNLRNKNRQNPYTFSGKVSEKWTEAPRRNWRRTRSLDQKT
jgi:hypothetical protein